jgi:hypothetical protein
MRISIDHSVEIAWHNPWRHQDPLNGMANKSILVVMDGAASSQQK